MSTTIYIVTCSKGRYDEAVTFPVAWSDDELRAKQYANECDEEVRSVKAAYAAWLKTNLAESAIEETRGVIVYAAREAWENARRTEAQRLAESAPLACLHWTDFGLGGIAGAPSFDVEPLEKIK